MNDQDKIAALTAENANLKLALAERKAKIANLMGEAARAGIAGAPVQAAPVGNPRDWLMDGSLIYRLSDDGINCDEINVTMVHGSRGALGREAAAAGLLNLICVSDSKAAPAAPAEPVGKLTKSEASKILDLAVLLEELRDEYRSVVNSAYCQCDSDDDLLGRVSAALTHDTSNPTGETK